MKAMTVLCSLLVAAGAVEAGQAAYIPAKAVVAQVLLDRAFEKSVETGRPVRPWSWADMAPVARLSIERIGMNEIALDKGSGQAMAFGPTLLPGLQRRGIGAPASSPLTATLTSATFRKSTSAT